MTATPAGPETPVRVTVYGSCVSRDAVDLAGGDRFTVVDYIARQSLLSAGHDASDRFPADAPVEHRFPHRMMLSDFTGDLPGRLAAAAPETDVLLWDLTDERHGVHVFADGAVVTRSIDLQSVPQVLAAVEGTRHLPLGDPEHLRLWCEAATALREELVASGLLERTVVLQVPWALVTADGERTRSSMGTTAIQANETYRPYVEHLRELGFPLLELQPLGVLADPEHRWGPAPFHYTQDVYEEIIGQVLERVDAARGGPGDV